MRGLQQSQPIAWNVMEAKRLAQSGVKELLVIGQDTTTYGWDFDKKKEYMIFLMNLMMLMD